MSDAASISLDGLKGWGGWSLFFLAVVWWIRGIPERRRAATEGEIALRLSYGAQLDRLTGRIDQMSSEHDADRASWMAERAAFRSEYEEDRKRWNAEREQWRRERTELLDHVAGLERKLKSYGSSEINLVEGPVNAPATLARIRKRRVS